MLDSVTRYKLVEIFPDYTHPIRFLLERADDSKNFKHRQAFMIMPFHQPDLSEFYFSHLKPFLEKELNINLYRADDLKSNDIIIETIYKLIEESEFVIADTTYDNKNAFYELGYAAAKEKEIITIQNKNAKQQLFFDRAHIRSILYNLEDLKPFLFDLRATVESIRSKQGH